MQCRVSSAPCEQHLRALCGPDLLWVPLHSGPHVCLLSSTGVPADASLAARGSHLVRLYSYRQQLCRCLLSVCRSIVADVVDTLAAAGGNALKLVHTHDGAAAAAMALAYATPKDRKRLVKGMKGEHMAVEGVCWCCVSSELCAPSA